MDLAGIEAAILSVSAPGIDMGGARPTADLARQCNEHQADMVTQPHPLAEGLPELGEQDDVEQDGEPAEGERDRRQQREQDGRLVEQGQGQRDRRQQPGDSLEELEAKHVDGQHPLAEGGQPQPVPLEEDVDETLHPPDPLPDEPGQGRRGDVVEHDVPRQQVGLRRVDGRGDGREDRGQAVGGAFGGQ